MKTHGGFFMQKLFDMTSYDKQRVIATTLIINI